MSDTPIYDAVMVDLKFNPACKGFPEAKSRVARKPKRETAK